MNNRSFTISLVVALLAVLMVHQYVTSTEETYKRQYGVESVVVVARRNIKELDLLDKTNLMKKVVPKTFMQPGVGTKLSQFLGGLAIAPIMKGEQVTRSKVTMLGSRTGLSRQVAVGKRAVTVRVSETKGVSMLIKPGDRVDVLSIIDYGKGNVDLIEMKTVLQDVLILATGKLITNTVPGILESDPYNKRGRKKVVPLTEYTSYNSVTIEVDPLDAQKLFFIDNQLGGVYLTLRNNDDNARESVDTINIYNILGKDSKRCKIYGKCGDKRPTARRRAPPPQTAGGR